jgi:chromosome segregation ATPase
MAQIKEREAALEASASELAEAYANAQTLDRKKQLALKAASEAMESQRHIVDGLRLIFDSNKTTAEKSRAAMVASKVAISHLEKDRVKLERSLKDLSDREWQANRAIQQPCDELLPETDFVVTMEADVQRLVGLFDNTADKKLKADVEAATQKYAEVAQVLQVRRQTVKGRAFDLHHAKSQSAKEASKNQIHRGPSAGERVSQMQLHQARLIVKTVFQKLGEREEAISKEGDELDALEIQYATLSVEMDTELKGKDEHVAELREELANYQHIVVDVAAERGKVDAAKRRVTENAATIVRLKRAIAALPAKEASVARLEADLKPLQEVVESLRADIASLEEEMAEKRQTLEALTGECQRQEEQLGRLEAEADEKESQVEAVDKALGDVLKSVEPSLSFARIIARFTK